MKNFQWIWLWSCFCCLIFRILFSSWFKYFLTLRRDPWKCGTDVAWRSDVQCHRFVSLNVSWLCERTHTSGSLINEWCCTGKQTAARFMIPCSCNEKRMHARNAGSPGAWNWTWNHRRCLLTHALCRGSTDVFKSVVKSIVLVHAHVAWT